MKNPNSARSAGGSSEQALSFYMCPMATCPVAGRAPSDLSACDGWGRLIFRHTLVATVYLSFPFPLALPGFCNPILSLTHIVHAPER